jgi:hypothetical protein
MLTIRPSPLRGGQNLLSAVPLEPNQREKS